MLVLDRFEDEFAVIETAGGIIRVCSNSISPETSEGDVIFLDSDGVYKPDYEQTKKRRAEARALLEKLKKKADNS